MYGVNAAFDESYIPLPLPADEPEQIIPQFEQPAQTEIVNQGDYYQPQFESFQVAEQPEADDSAYYADQSCSQYDPSFACYDSNLASHTETGSEKSKN